MNEDFVSVQEQLGAFGIRLRELRNKRGWTIQDLSERSGLSKPFLSRLESGDRQASIAAVLTLSRVFGVSLGSLFESQVAVDPCVIVRSAEIEPRVSNGLSYLPLSNPERFFNLQPIRITVSPKRRGSSHYQHVGEEWIYVLSGELTLSLAGKMYRLGVGDSAHFDSRLPHRLICSGRRAAELLLVACPLAEEGKSEKSAKSIAGLANLQRRAIPFDREEGTRETRSPGDDEAVQIISASLQKPRRNK